MALVTKACSARVRSNAGPGLRHSKLSAIVGSSLTARWLVEELNVEATLLLNVSTRAGKLGALQWLRVQDPPSPWSDYTCNAAASNSHMEVL